MTTKSIATRRRFIRTAGAALSGPVALAVATVMPAAAADTHDDAAARLARLEDVDAIRALTRAYARHVNARELDKAAELFAEPAGARFEASLAGLTPLDFGDADAMEIARDRQTAAVRLAAAVVYENAIGPECPAVEMARQQGGGVVTRTEHVIVENAYVRHNGVWRIQRSTLCHT
jgi:hypothetical protein